MKKLYLILLFALLSSATLFAGEPWRPSSIAMRDNGNLIIANRAVRELCEVTAQGQIVKNISLPNNPNHLVTLEDKAYATCFDDNLKNSLLIVDLGSGAVEEIALDKCQGLSGIAISKDEKSLYLASQFQGTVSEFNIEKKQVLRSAKVLREPTSIVPSACGNYLFVTNFIPAERADLDFISSDVSVIDLTTFSHIKDIKLENGSNALHGAALSADGKYLFVSHNLGRYTVPTSQLLQGWMNTSAVSVVDTQSQEFVGSIIVDDVERGAAGTWGIVCDDEKMYVSHSGVHEISVIDYKKMIEKFEAYSPKSSLAYDLRFLYGIRERIALEGNGPRDFIVDKGVAYVPMYFSDHLNIYDSKAKSLQSHLLNADFAESDINKGERIFNDATYCFQNWQSCNGCHPGDGRSDGMNWDLMNDGVGNSKNCKSLLLSMQTPPSMISGIRESAALANRKGFTHIQFHEISEQEALYVDAYSTALKAVPSPYLVNGELSELAKEGRKVYEKYKCDDCHSGAYYTDLQMYVIGDDVEFENGWDTPTLIEVWRTAPYLFDGRAYTLDEVFGVHKHGIDKKISKKDLDALVEYVNSL
ncbi:MAG: YncE family protein [Rikenellaceae bacterium]